MITDITDTIAAIATAVGDGGIGIVRISGRNALNIADKLFVSKDDRKPSDYKSYTLHYGWIIRARRPAGVMSKENVVDEVILTVMRAPRSYTKEDVVEINSHGGIVALRAVLDLVLENGARLAEPGEFTKRAFLNGRIDLTQAEAVLDAIRAKTDSALRLSVEQLGGVLSVEINKIRGLLVDALAIIEANIDFPEDDIDASGIEGLERKITGAKDKLDGLIDTAACGRVFREGIKAVICGRPNVGKSSLLNALLKQERSIVTPVAGTTRDTIEEIIDIRGIPVRIVDTAGILQPRGLVEKKAVMRSKKHIDSADLIMLVLDNSRKLAKEDLSLIMKAKKRTAIAIINKIDLKRSINIKFIENSFKHIIPMSAKKLTNINLLEEEIVAMVYKGKAGSGESVMVSNLRHIQSLRGAQKLVAETLLSLDNKLSAEFVAQSIKDALGYLDEILGKKFSEDLLDKIFSEFCIGK